MNKGIIFGAFSKNFPKFQSRIYTLHRRRRLCARFCKVHGRKLDAHGVHMILVEDGLQKEFTNFDNSQKFSGGTWELKKVVSFWGWTGRHCTLKLIEDHITRQGWVDFCLTHMDKISTKERYINLSTRKRNGSFVNTPVWFAQDGESNNYYIFSLMNAGKVKRIRNFPDVKVASCSFRGKLKGDWIDAKAELVDGFESVRLAYLHLRRKYGISFRIGDFFSWIIGNYHRRQIIRIRIKVNKIP